MIHRLPLLVCVVAILASSLTLNCQSMSGAEPDTEYGFQVGKSMAFHVVDFIGKGPRGGGCPSVMISNSRKMGVEIWSRSLDDSVFQLAAELQDVLPAGERPNGFLLVFDKPTPEAVAKKLDKFALKKFFVCSPRNAAQKLIHRADPDEKYSTIVFVEDRKVIKVVWQIPQGMLNEKAIERVVKDTRGLLPEKR